jgi:hypothetical protein
LLSKSRRSALASCIGLASKLPMIARMAASI